MAGGLYGELVPGSIQSIERAAAVLNLLAAAPSRLRLADVAVALSLPKGTAHGILRTLVELGWVEQDRTTGRYQLGSGLLHPLVEDLDANELRARSMNWADPLAARSGEAVRIGMLLEAEVLVVHYVFRPDGTTQTADVGARLPVHATALGKALLAYLPGRTELLGNPLAPYTTRTATSRNAFVAELAGVIHRGFAMDVGEFVAGQASIAAPIRGYGGLVVAAVELHGDIDRLCDSGGTARAALVTQVRDCARAIARELEVERTARAAR